MGTRKIGAKAYFPETHLSLSLSLTHTHTPRDFDEEILIADDGIITFPPRKRVIRVFFFFRGFFQISKSLSPFFLSTGNGKLV